MFTEEHSYHSYDQERAYQLCKSLFGKGRASYIMVGADLRDIVPDEIKLAGIYLLYKKAERIKKITDEARAKSIPPDKLDKLLDEDIELRKLDKERKKLLEAIRKAHSEKESIPNRFAEYGERMKKILVRSKDKPEERRNCIPLRKFGIDVYLLKRTRNSVPDAIFLGLLADVEEENPYTETVKLRLLKPFLNKEYWDYLMGDEFDASPLRYTSTTGKKAKYLLQHSFPLKLSYIGPVSGRRFYAVIPTNFNKEMTPKEIMERCYQKFGNSDRFDMYFSRPFSLSRDYHKKHFPELFNHFAKFYKKNNGIEPDSDIIYEKYRIEGESIYSAKNVTFNLNYLIEGFIVVADSMEDVFSTGNILKRFTSSIKRYEKSFYNFLNKVFVGNEYDWFSRNFLPFRWKDLFIYYDLYKDNRTFNELVQKDATVFIYEAFFAANLIKILSLFSKYRRVPVFLVDADSTEEIEFFNFFNASNYLISSYPFQSLKKGTMKKVSESNFQEMAYIAKNFFLSMFKNSKELSFSITKPASGVKKGMLIIEEFSNIVVSDFSENIDELRRRFRVLHFYKFNVSGDKVKIEYLGNSVKLSTQPATRASCFYLDKDDYVIAVAERLDRDSYKKVLSEIFRKDVEESQFCYVKSFSDFPFIKKYKKEEIKGGPNKNARAFFLFREDSGALASVIDDLLGEESRSAKSFALLYTPPANPEWVREFPFYTTHSNMYLIHHLKGLEDIIEQVLFGYHIYTSESLFIPYAKPKKNLPLKKGVNFKRCGKDYPSFQSTLLLEILFLTKRLVEGR